MLRVDLDALPKQGHTAKRMFDRLVEEHGAAEVFVRDGPHLRHPASLGHTERTFTGTGTSPMALPCPRTVSYAMS